MGYPGTRDRRIEQYELLSRDESSSTAPIQSSRHPRHRLSFRGWRGTIAAGCCTTLVVLILNVVLLIISLHKPEAEARIHVLFRGSCETMRSSFIAVHIVINILSTLLLGASNVAMQCLAAPTRHEIDEAHSNGTWVHIGVFGLRNLRLMPWWRIVLCAVLAFSSIPLHLVYNSTIFSKTAARQPIAPVVASNFLTSTRFDLSNAWVYSRQESDSSQYQMPDGTFVQPRIYDDMYLSDDLNVTKYIALLHQNAAKLERLSGIDCITAFSNTILTRYKSTLVFTKLTNETDSLLSVLSYTAFVYDSSGVSAGVWYVSPDDPDNTTSYRSLISIQAVQNKKSNTYRIFLLPVIVLIFLVMATALPLDSPSKSMLFSRAMPVSATLIRVPDLWTVPNTAGGGLAEADYCLAEKAEERCELAMSVTILSVVILCNVFKLICFTCILFAEEYHPLITIGDAIASFISDTRRKSTPRRLVNIDFVRHRNRNLDAHDYRSLYEFDTYHPRRFRWYRAASRIRWGTTLAAALVLIVVATFLLAQSGQAISFSQFGSNTTDLTVPGGGSLIRNVLLANVPQLLISLVYLLYNALFTCMSLAAEYMSYVERPRTLRVSSPAGAQRSTYWLQLKFRYAIPLMIVMATLHWLVSQSIFLVYIESYRFDDDQVPHDVTNICGWDPAAVLMSLLVGAGLVLFIVTIGWFRRYPVGIPMASSCSRAIEAACCRAKCEDPDIALWPLSYGVLKEVGPGGNRRVAFSAKPVEPLIEGEAYE